MTIEKLKLHNHIACSHQTSQDGDIPQRSPTQNLHMTSYILYLPFQNAYGHKTRQGADFKRKASTLWPVDNMNNLKSSDKSKKLYFYLERFETQRLSRHWLFANFEIVFHFAANLSSCFNDGGAAFYYERFYTFQWVLTQRNCPLKWFWDNPLNKWLSVSLLISMQWNPNFPTLTIQYDHCPWLKTFLQKMWVITNRSTIHHDPPRPTTTKKIPTTNLHQPKQTHYYPKNTQNHLSPPKKYQLPLTTTQNMLTAIQRHTKSTHHHPSPLTIKSHHLPKPTTPQNISATTHHHHPSPKKKPPLPTTTPNIYSITHNIPTTTHHHPIYNHHHPN